MRVNFIHPARDALAMELAALVFGFCLFVSLQSAPYANAGLGEANTASAAIRPLLFPRICGPSKVQNLGC
jgi:hypothetical protein